MRKLIWYTFPLQTVGGGERLLLEGLRWFRNNGTDAYLFADGEPIQDEALFDSTYSPSILIYPKQKSSGPFGRFTRVYRKIRFLQSQNPDVIIANSQAEALRIYFYNLFSCRKLPYICFIHGSFFQFPDETDKYSLVFRKSFSRIREEDPVYKELIPSKAPNAPFLKRLKSEVLNYCRYLAVGKAKAVFVLTEKAKKEIVLLYRHPNVVVAHGAFSKDIFAYRLKENKKSKWKIEGRLMIFSMCRLVAKKRADLIIKSFGLFSRKNPQAILLLGGNGPEKENLQQLVKDLNLEDSVRFLGYVPDDELLDYYCSADIFVTADNADYDIATFVALALGKKVVASSQHEFEPRLAGLNLVFHAEPTTEGFTKAYEEAIHSNRPPCDSAEKLLEDYSWEYYFTKIRQHL